MTDDQNQWTAIEHALAAVDAVLDDLVKFLGDLKYNDSESRDVAGLLLMGGAIGHLTGAVSELRQGRIPCSQALQRCAWEAISTNWYLSRQSDALEGWLADPRKIIAPKKVRAEIKRAHTDDLDDETLARVDEDYSRSSSFTHPTRAALETFFRSAEEKPVYRSGFEGSKQERASIVDLLLRTALLLAFLGATTSHPWPLEAAGELAEVARSTADALKVPFPAAGP